MKRAAFIIVLLTSLRAAAEPPLVTITCDDPEGFLVVHGQNLLRGPGIHHEAETAERFGSKPTFILDPLRPKKLIVLWGSYIPPGVSRALVQALDLEGKVEEAEIVFHDERQITAIQLYEYGVNTYTLYPRIDYGIFTKSGHWVTEEQTASAWIYYGRCSFSE